MDVAPKQKTTPRQKIAQLVRLFGTTARGERVNAWRALERTMEGAEVSWSDIGNWIEQGGEPDDGSYSEAELQEFGQVMRAEGVEAGIKIGMARARQSNGHIVLPEASEMADYCYARLAGRRKSIIASSTRCSRTRRRACRSREGRIWRILHSTRRKGMMTNTESH